MGSRESASRLYVPREGTVRNSKESVGSSMRMWWCEPLTTGRSKPFTTGRSDILVATEKSYNGVGGPSLAG